MHARTTLAGLTAICFATAGAAPKRRDRMIWVPGGTFSMGCGGCGMPDALPVHEVKLDGFWLDETPVTNRQFAEFVAQTGYVTVAERAPTAAEFPDAPPENLVAGSVVFSPPAHEVPLDDHLRWWSYRPGASWRHPGGPGTDLGGLEDHPVVQVAYDDAQAYARWAGKRLPTEAEFEYAARGGLENARYAWGNELRPQGHWMANVFQGHFPDRNDAEDGYRATSPVKAFPANGYGFFDMAGNVWEWCADWYRPDAYAREAALGSPAVDPRGPTSSDDPDEPSAPKRVLRGGSFLCTAQYCRRYLVGARWRGDPDTGSSNIGFRCARSGP